MRIKLPAIIKSDRSGWITASITNIWMGGIHVEAAPVIAKDDRVVLRVELGRGSGRWIQEFPCVVTHADQRGKGLVLAADNRATLSALEKLSEAARKYAVVARDVMEAWKRPV